MNVRWTTLLVRVALINGSVNGSNSTTSRLAGRTWRLLRPTGSTGHRVVVVHVHVILVYLNWLSWALASMHVVEGGLSVLPGSRHHSSICILGVQSPTESRFDYLVSRVLLLRILLIDNILLELGLLLLLRVLVGLLKWDLLDVHLLLLHTALADYRGLVRVESGLLLLVVDVGRLHHNTCDIWAILESVVAWHMAPDDRLGTGVFGLLRFRINAESVIVLLLLSRPFFSLHLLIEGFSFFEYLH